MSHCEYLWIGNKHYSNKKGWFIVLCIHSKNIKVSRCKFEKISIEIRDKKWGTFKHKLCMAVISYDIV